MKRRSGNLSPGHSYFPLGIICGRQWGSLEVEDHLRSILGIIFSLRIIYGRGSVAVLHSSPQLYLTMIRPTVGFRHVDSFEVNITASFGPDDC